MAARKATGSDVRPEGANCGECPLGHFPIVLGEGPSSARLAIVGEAPGDDEVRFGRPFIGRAGKLLNQMLDEVGIKRDEALITNSVLCRPIPHRAPTAEEIGHCNGRLLKELKDHGVEIVVAMGQSALTAFGITGRIGQRRSHLFNVDELTVLPTWHTAYVLRNPSKYQDVVDDLRQAKDLLDGRGSNRPGLHHIIYEGFHHLEEFLYHQRGQVPVIDIETRSDNGEIICISWGVDTGDYIRVLTVPIEELGHVGPLLQENSSFIGHVSSFEYRVLAEQLGVRTHIAGDTAILHYLFDARAGTHALDQVVRQMYPDDPDLPRWEKFKPLRNKGLENLPREEVYWYNAMDVYYTTRLSWDLWAMIDERSQALYQHLLMPAANVLAKMETRGTQLDMPRLEQETVKHEELLERLEAAIQSLTWEGFNPRSPKQVGKFLYDELDMPVLKVTNTGSPSTDEETLRILEAQTGHSFISTLLDYRGVQKTLSTYLRPFKEKADSEGRIHGRFNLNGASTGRLSSSDPNLQNITARKGDDPNMLRNLFQASDGHTWVSADYSQLEIRVLAYLSRDQSLIDILASGGDLHRQTASRIFHVPEDQVTDQLRSVGKTCTFALIYGAEAPRLVESIRTSLGVEISESEAQQIIDSWFAAFPQAREWMLDIRATVLDQKELWTPLGRKRRWPFVDHAVLREAVNFPVQSLASDITLLSLLALDRELPKDDKLLLIVHDEIDLETSRHPGECAADVERIMLRVATDVTEGLVPMKVDVEVGDRWGSLMEVEEYLRLQSNGNMAS